MSLVENIKDYISTCPHLKLFQDAFVDITVDFSQSDQATTYSINKTPCKPILQTYVNGDTKRQFLFTFTSVELFGSDVANNISNLEFFEKFSQWLEDNTNNKILPIMEEGKKAQKIKALTDGYLFDNQADLSKARYSIQCQLIYSQKK